MTSSFQLLFHNDLTNILTCVSPYHGEGEGFDPDMLRAAVAESAATGAQAHLMQPGFCWVPWWPCRTFSFDAYRAWFAERFPDRRPLPFTEYVLNGGDLVRDFIEACAAVNQQPLISLRLNHPPQRENEGGEHMMSSPFYDRHPEWRCGPNLTDNRRCLNWLVPAVREEKLKLVRDLARQYPLAGIELDFMRYCWFFPAETDPEQRIDTMTAFIREVRAVLDRARGVSRRRLAVRIPHMLEAMPWVGIDPERLTHAGVDMVTLSDYYFTTQSTELTAIRRRLPDAALFVEGTYCTMRRQNQLEAARRLATRHHHITTAHLAHARGADGYSLFNFVYYRAFGFEPPFDIGPRLQDPAWLARQPHWYFVDESHNQFRCAGIQRPLPHTMQAGATFALDMDMAPTPWQTRDGLLRLKTADPSPDRRWRVECNGRALERIPAPRMPLPHTYDVTLGSASDYHGFRLPCAAVIDGINRLRLTLDQGPTADLVLVDAIFAADQEPCPEPPA